MLQIVPDLSNSPSDINLHHSDQDRTIKKTLKIFISICLLKLWASSTVHTESWVIIGSFLIDPVGR